MMDFMTSDGDWELYKESGEWKTEWMHDDKSSYESFRITGCGDVPLYNIMAVIYEMDLIHKWMPLWYYTLSLHTHSMFGAFDPF